MIQYSCPVLILSNPTSNTAWSICVVVQAPAYMSCNNTRRYAWCLGNDCSCVNLILHICATLVCCLLRDQVATYGIPYKFWTMNALTFALATALPLRYHKACVHSSISLCLVNVSTQCDPGVCYYLIHLAWWRPFGQPTHPCVWGPVWGINWNCYDLLADCLFQSHNGVWNRLHRVKICVWQRRNTLQQHKHKPNS